MRFGLVGTGYWAQENHAQALTSTDGVSFTAIWGRNPDAVAAASARFGVAGFSGEEEFDAFLSFVDAVEFAVPPHVQSRLALRAIRAGKHVLMEKPIAVSLAEADELVAAAAEHKVTTVVFFTTLFDPRIRKIVAEAKQAAWSGGQGLWLGSALMDDNPFNTPWRHDKGGLWDLGPHAVSVLWATLGPIVEVGAEPGANDLVHLWLRHESGVTSTASMTLMASSAADGFATQLWGSQGRQEVPVDDVDSLASLQTALGELVAHARDGRPHELGIPFGREIVRVLSEAEAALAARER